MISKLFTLKNLMYAAAAAIILIGFIIGNIVHAQSTTMFCYQAWWGGFISGDPAYCGTPPPGSACSPGCTGPIGGFCPTDYCWTVTIPAPPPACVANQGSACSSATPNACGMWGSGTVQCNGSCSATTPSDALCPPPPPACVANQGAACSSSPNACSMTASGSVQCDGSCSATTPAPIDACPSDAGLQCSSSSCTPPAGPSAPTASLSAAPTTITLGDSSVLTWSSSNATSCTGTGTGFSTGGAASGNDSVTPASTGVHTYQIQCTGPGGTSPVDSVNITVNPASGGGGSCTGAGPVTITASPNRVQAGQGTTLSWTAADAASATCTVTNQNTGALLKTTTVSSCSASDSVAVSSVAAQTTYRVTCGALTKDAIVNIVPKFEEF
ncbi:MAG: hypothetical protein V4681_03705 [Patescibacteria group bacterium]